MDRQNIKTQATRTRRQSYIVPKRSLPKRYPLTTIWVSNLLNVVSKNSEIRSKMIDFDLISF